MLTGASNLVRLRNALQKTDGETVSASSRAARLIEELQRRREEARSTTRPRSRSASASRSSRPTSGRWRRARAGSRRAPGSRRRAPNAPERAAPAPTAATSPGSRSRAAASSCCSTAPRACLMTTSSTSSACATPARRAAAPRSSGAAPSISRAGSRARCRRAPQYQFYGFNTEAGPLLEGTAGKWLDGSDAAQVDKLVKGIEGLVPREGRRASSMRSAP